MATASANAIATRSWAQKSWSLYNFLLLVRVCFAPVLMGYVHPDEFFQGGQELWFGCPPSRPWEFEPHNALRSVVPPSIMVWWPLQVYSNLTGVSMEHLSGWIVWVIPRVTCAIFSIFAVDMSVWALAKPISVPGSVSNKAVPLPVLMVASAWPTMVLLSRPFTNAMETWILALLFRIVMWDGRTSQRPKPTIALRHCVAVGALSALGMFTRFTFVCFAVPIIVYFGYKMVRQLGIFGWLFKPALAYYVFLVVVGDIMDRDSEFYGRTALTPWNAFLYNSQKENLENHGLHPRWTHAVVNMMILYGPMAVLGYAVSGVSNSRLVGPISETQDPIDTTRSRTVVALCQWTIFCGLGFLSLAPHQEPRFLLPLLLPLALLVDNPWTRQYEQYLSKIWLGFNVLLLLFFGIMHQGGVVPSLLALGSSLASRTPPSAVIFYHTYMPPTFMSRMVGTRKGRSCRSLPVIDLDGSNSMTALASTVSEKLSCDSSGVKSNVLIVAAPGIGQDVDGGVWEFRSGWCNTPNMSCESIWQHSPHVSTENFPSLDLFLRHGLPLSIYEISCL